MCRCPCISGWRSKRWRNWRKCVSLQSMASRSPSQWRQEITMRWGRRGWGAGLGLPTWALVFTCIFCPLACLRLVRQQQQPPAETQALCGPIGHWLRSRPHPPRVGGASEHAPPSDKNHDQQRAHGLELHISCLLAVLNFPSAFQDCENVASLCAGNCQGSLGTPTMPCPPTYDAHKNTRW
jgi:hypothetical protein